MKHPYPDGVLSGGEGVGAGADGGVGVAVGFGGGDESGGVALQRGSEGGGEHDFGGGVGWNGHCPFEGVAVFAPLAAYGAVWGAVCGFNAAQSFGEDRFHQYFLESDSVGVIFDAGKVFVHPYEHVAEEHHVVARVRGGVGGVSVP